MTTRCNYDCIHCFRRGMEEPYGDMDPGLFERVVREARAAGVRKIVFSGWGEPLVHPRITEFIGLVKEAGMEVLLNTNGSLLGYYAEELLRLGVDEIVVSVDSVETDLYQAIRIGGSLPTVLKGLMRLKELRREMCSWKPVVSIQFTVNRMNYRDVPKLVGFAKLVGATRVTISNVVPLSAEHEEGLACYADRECLGFMERAREVLGKESLDSNVAVDFPSFGVQVERKCPFVSRYAAYIRRDGGVAPCIYYAHRWRTSLMGVEREIMPVVFGSLTRRSLLEIWRNRRYAEFRFRAAFFAMPSCLDCPLARYCLYTLSNEVDCWGNAPTCAHCPYSHDMARCPL